MKVTIIANGPICLDTNDAVAIRSAGGSEQKTGPLFLCRCGHSAAKPFCDGTHRKVKFEGPSAELEVG